MRLLAAAEPLQALAVSGQLVGAAVVEPQPVDAEQVGLTRVITPPVHESAGSVQVVIVGSPSGSHMLAVSQSGA